MKLCPIKFCTLSNHSQFSSCCVKMNKITKFGISILLGSATGVALASVGVTFAVSIGIGAVVATISAVALFCFCRPTIASQNPNHQPISSKKPISTTSSPAPVVEEPLELNEKTALNLLCKISLLQIRNNVLCVHVLDTLQQNIPIWSLHETAIIDQNEINAFIRMINHTSTSNNMNIIYPSMIYAIGKLFGFINVFSIDFSEILEKSKSLNTTTEISRLFSDNRWNLVSPYINRFARCCDSASDESQKETMMQFAKIHLGAWFFPAEAKEAREIVIENILNCYLNNDSLSQLFT